MTVWLMVRLYAVVTEPGELGVPTIKGIEPLAYRSTRLTDDGVVSRVMFVWVALREAASVAPAK